MRISGPAMLLAVTILGTAIPLYADPISIVATGRSVFATSMAGQDFQLTQAQDKDVLSTGTTSVWPPADVANAGASLSSSIQSVLFEGAGSSFVNHTSVTATGGGGSEATYYVEFDAAQPVTYTFNGDFSTVGTSQWLAALHDVALDTDVFHYQDGDGSSPMTTALLGPGRYEFFVRSSSSIDLQLGSSETSSAFRFNMALAEAPSPTPEPASLLLMATGVAGLVRRARRRA